jgi:hypothetical protein
MRRKLFTLAAGVSAVPCGNELDHPLIPPPLICRKLITVMAWVSGALCLAVGALGVRSYWVGYWTTFGGKHVGVVLGISRAGVLVSVERVRPPFLPNGGAVPTEWYEHGSPAVDYLTLPEFRGHTFAGWAHRRLMAGQGPNFPQVVDEVVGPAYVLILGLLVPPVVALRLRRKGRLRPGRCPACGYDLRATPDRCPECGAVPAAKGERA